MQSLIDDGSIRLEPYVGDLKAPDGTVQDEHGERKEIGEALKEIGKEMVNEKGKLALAKNATASSYPVQIMGGRGYVSLEPLEDI